MHKVSPLLLALWFLVPGYGTAQEHLLEATRIGGVDSIWSEELREQRPVLIYTPPSYDDESLGTQHYPVLYLLDGDSHFQTVSGIVQAHG